MIILDVDMASAAKVDIAPTPVAATTIVVDAVVPVTVDTSQISAIDPTTESVAVEIDINLPAITKEADVLFSGEGVLAAAAWEQWERAAILDAIGQLAATACESYTCSIVLSGTGSLSGAAHVGGYATTPAFSTEGILTALIKQGYSRDAALSMIGTLTAAAIKNKDSVAATLSGAGTLTGTIGVGIAGLPSTSGSLSGVLREGYSRAAVLNGAGTVSAATGITKDSVTSQLSMTGSVTATKSEGYTRTSALSATGNLAAEAAGGQGAAALLGMTGTLTATRGVTKDSVTPQLSAAGTLTAAVGVGGSAALSATGTLSATVYSPQRSAALSATGTLSALAYAGVVGNLATTGTLSATATKTSDSAAANLSATGSLSATKSEGYTRAAAPSATGTLSATAVKTQDSATTSFNAIGTLAAVVGIGASAALSVTGILSATAEKSTESFQRDAALAGVGALSGSMGVGQSVTLSGAGTLSATKSEGYTRTVAPSATGTLTATASVTKDSTAPQLSGAGTLTGVLTEGYTRAAAPSMAGTVSATATKTSDSAAASLSMTGTLSGSVPELTRLQTSMASAMNGTGYSTHMIIGDSVSSCYTGAAFDFPNSWHRKVKASMLALGYLDGGTGIVTADFNGGYDPRITLSANWVNDGLYFHSTAGAATLTLASDVAGTICHVYYRNNSTNFTVAIDGDTPVTVTPSGADTIGTYTVTGLANTTHSVVITASAADTRIIGVEVAAAAGVQFHDFAKFGQSGIYWYADTGTTAIRTLATGMVPDPDCVHICIGAIDQLNAVGTPAETATAIENIRNLFPDSYVILYVEPDPAGVAQATWETFVADMHTLADTLACPIVDLYAVMGTSTDMAAAGTLGVDGMHPNAAGQTVIYDTAWAVIEPLLASARTTPALAGTGTLTATQSEGYTRTSAPSATGTLSAAVGVGQSITLSATGTLTAAAGITSDQRSAALSATGTLSGTKSEGYSRTASPSMTGTLSTAVGTGTAVTLSATGTLSAVATKTSDSATATLTGTGTITAVLRESYTRTAAVSMTGTTSATAVKTRDSAAAALTGTGTLSATKSEGYTRTAVPSMTGTITATRGVTKDSVTAAPAMTGTLTATATTGGGVSTLTDDFATFDTNKWNAVGTGSSVSGQLNLSATTSWFRVDSTTTYDLTGSSMFFELVVAPDPATFTTIIGMKNAVDSNANAVFVRVDATGLNFVRAIATVETGTAITYSPAVHRWLRIRESGGTLYFDTSPNCTNWFQQYSVAVSTLDITTMYVGFQGGASSGTGTIIIDNFNTTSARSGPYPVAVTSAAIGSSRSPVAAFPTDYTPATNDIVVVWPSSTTTATIVMPANWVNPLGTTVDVESDAHEISIGYHVVTATEQTNVTRSWTLTNWYDTTETGDISACVIRGADATTVVDDINSWNDTGNSATPHTLAGLTGTNLSTGSIVLSAVAKDGTGSYTTPAGWTQLVSANNNQGKWLGMCNTLTTASTNVDATNITPNTGDEGASITIAILPA